MFWCWILEEARWGSMFVDRRKRVDMWSIWTVPSYLYLKNWQVYFKCIYRQFCSCLSMAVLALLIYRQLYLVVMLFLGSKWSVCLARKKIGDTIWLTLGLHVLFFAFHSLFHLPSWSDAIPSGSVNPHLSPFSGLTESLLANVSLFLSTHSTITKVTWYLVHSQQSQSQHKTQSLTRTQTQNLHLLRCPYSILTFRHKYRHTAHNHLHTYSRKQPIHVSLFWGIYKKESKM